MLMFSRFDHYNTISYHNNVHWHESWRNVCNLSVFGSSWESPQHIVKTYPPAEAGTGWATCLDLLSLGGQEIDTKKHRKAAPGVFSTERQRKNVLIEIFKTKNVEESN